MSTSFKFLNRSNAAVNIAVTNGNVIYWHKNGLAPGERWTVHPGYVWYDFHVVHDLKENRFDPKTDNVFAILGYVLTGVGLAVAIGSVVPTILTFGGMTPAVAAGIALTGAGVALSAGGVALEAVDAATNPATLAAMYGANNYDIEIAGNAHLAAKAEEGKAVLRFDDVAMRWKNKTAKHKKFRKTGDFRWIWQQDPVYGSALNVAANGKGEMHVVGTNGLLYRRESPAAPWEAITDGPFRFKLPQPPEVKDPLDGWRTGSFETLSYLPDGRLFASVRWGERLFGFIQNKGRWRLEHAYRDVRYVATAPNGWVYYMKNGRLHRQDPARNTPHKNDLWGPFFSKVPFATLSPTTLVAPNKSGELRTFTAPELLGKLPGGGIASSKVGGDDSFIVSIARLSDKELVGIGTDKKVYFARIEDLLTALRA